LSGAGKADSFKEREFHKELKLLECATYVIDYFYCQDMLDTEFYSSIFKTQDGEMLFSKYRDRITSSSLSRDASRMYEDLEELGVIGER
jgi:hypothetical protein